PLSGLITACALVKGKDLDNVDVEFVLKRFKEKRFAAGVNREQILECEELGFTLDKFIAIGIAGMKRIKKELGL
ncbi:MAG: phosphohydrolase, partial [Caldisericaceae bacterium]